MAQLALFNEGVLSHFVYSMELRYGTSLLGVGIPALNDATDVCINQCCSEEMGIPSSLQGRLRPEDIVPPRRGEKAVISCFSKKNDKLRVKRSAYGGRSKEQSDEVMGGGRGLSAKTLT